MDHKNRKRILWKLISSYYKGQKKPARWNYRKYGFLFFPRFSILVRGHPKPFVGVAVSYCYVFISLSPRQQVFISNPWSIKFLGLRRWCRGFWGKEAAADEIRHYWLLLYATRRDVWNSGYGKLSRGTYSKVLCWGKETKCFLNINWNVPNRKKNESIGHILLSPLNTAPVINKRA